MGVAEGVGVLVWGCEMLVQSFSLKTCVCLSRLSYLWSFDHNNPHLSPDRKDVLCLMALFD